jgi:hypothetical protein
MQQPPQPLQTPQQPAKPEIIVNQPEKNSPLHFNGKNILLSLAVFVLVGGVGVGVYLVDQRTNLLPQAKEVQSTPAATIASGPRANAPTGTLPPRVRNTPQAAITTSASPTNTPLGTPSATPTAQKGDGNGDGNVDNQDLELAKSLRNKPASANPQLDMNSDGVINSFDISALSKQVSSQ